MGANGEELQRSRDAGLTGSAGENLVAEFWRQWQEYRDALYRLCLKMMKYNHTDAEEALSRACIKAWEKVPRFAGTIGNLKSWIFQLTKNLCIDIIRQRSRSALAVENIELIGQTDTIATALVETPEDVLETEEKYNEIRRAIADLPQTLRDTFILHFYQELPHKEIAREQGISYDNVCQRISQARKKLKQKLSGYFREEGETQKKTPARRSASSTTSSRGREQRPQKVEVPEVPIAKETATATEAATPEIVGIVVEQKTQIAIDLPEPKEPQGENAAGEQLQESEAPVLLATSTVEDKLPQMQGDAESERIEEPALVAPERPSESASLAIQQTKWGMDCELLAEGDRAIPQEKVRETKRDYMLCFYEERSYPEIARRQENKFGKIRKIIPQLPAIISRKLRGDFSIDNNMAEAETIKQ